MLAFGLLTQKRKSKSCVDIKIADLVSISSTFYVQIFRTNVVSAAFSSCMYVVKAAETTFLQKIRL